MTAPGETIYTCDLSGYGYHDGTSFSTPIVSGIAAALKAINPDLTPQQIKNVICCTAKDRGDANRDNYYGYGEVNFYNAVLFISQDPQSSISNSDKTIPKGTVIFDRPGPLSDIALSYVNNPANLSEVQSYVVEGSKIYIKTFSGEFIENLTNAAVNKAVIHGVKYKNENGETYLVGPSDTAVIPNN